MKEKFRNWIKRWGITLWLVVAAVLLATVGSLAAYTNFSSVKRVVSTDKAGDTLFSSNYLSLVPYDTQNTKYPTRRVSPSEVKEGDTVTGYTFTVQVCNYAYGNPTSWNTKDITYTFSVKVLPRSGDTLPDNTDTITVTQGRTSGTYSSDTHTYTFSNQPLSKEKANYLPYTITVPEALKDQIKLEIEAKPNETSKKATNSQKLAANITLSTLEPTQDWSGKFIDDKDYAPSAYDAFNYEIYGNGAGTVTLKWNSDVLQASKWFTDEHGEVSASEENGVNYKSISFSVGTSDNAPTAYQLQFYKAPNATMPETWDELEGYVTVKFTPKSETQSAG